MRRGKLPLFPSIPLNPGDRLRPGASYSLGENRLFTMMYFIHGINRLLPRVLVFLLAAVGVLLLALAWLSGR